MTDVADVADAWLQGLSWDEQNGLSFADDVPQEVVAAFSEHDLTSKARSRIAIEALKVLRQNNPDLQTVQNDPRSFIRDRDCPVVDEWVQITREQRPELIEGLRREGEGQKEAQRRVFAMVQDAIMTIVARSVEQQLDETVVKHERQ